MLQQDWTNSFIIPEEEEVQDPEGTVYGVNILTFVGYGPYGDGYPEEDWVFLNVLFSTKEKAQKWIEERGDNPDNYQVTKLTVQ